MTDRWPLSRQRLHRWWNNARDTHPYLLLVTGALLAIPTGILVTNLASSGTVTTIDDVSDPTLHDCGDDIPLVLGPGSGPDRTTFTVAEPAPRAMLNSIVDSESSYGDERGFFDVKDVRQDVAGGFCNVKSVIDGQRLLLRVYVNNSAAASLATEDGQGDFAEDPDRPGVVREAQLSIRPDSQAASLQFVTAEIYSSTTDPERVYDSVVLESDGPFRLDFVRGSGRVYTNTHPEGLELDDGVWGGWARIGSLALDGVIPPGYEYAIIVTAEVRVTSVR